MHQYIRTNSVALDLADDLIRIFNKREDDVADSYTGNGLAIGLTMLKGKMIGNE